MQINYHTGLYDDINNKYIWRYNKCDKLLVLIYCIMKERNTPLCKQDISFIKKLKVADIEQYLSFYNIFNNQNIYDTLREINNTDDNDSNLEVEECCICYNEKSINRFYTGECGHKICNQCKQIGNIITCPMCRRENY